MQLYNTRSCLLTSQFHYNKKDCSKKVAILRKGIPETGEIKISCKIEGVAKKFESKHKKKLLTEIPRNSERLKLETPK